MRKNWLQATAYIIIAMMVSLFAYGEGELVLYYLFEITNTPLLFGISLLSGAVTLALLWKNMRNKMTLSKYYLYAILLSLVLVVLVLWIMTFFLSSTVFPHIPIDLWIHFFSSKIGIFLGYNMFFICSMILTGLFGLTFSSLTRRKVHYIEYISREVKLMEQDGLEHSLSINGNDELSELSRSINHMAESLLQKEKREKELITNISHDLRSPMTSILGYVDLLKQNGTDNSDKFNEYIEVVDRRLQNLNEMINELFELSKLSETGVMLNMHKQDIMLLLRQLVQENEVILRQSELGLKSFIPKDTVFMAVDAKKIARAFQNLFENAKKYAVKHTDIIIDVKAFKDYVIVEMSNQFDQSHAPDISLLFNRFYKEDESRSNTNSSGLGLAIVKRIVQLHGGTIEAEIFNNTICFCIKIPK
jgi:signal transduction histidine kinase